jgi:hypothetical protein
MDSNLVSAPREDLTKHERAIYFLGNNLEMSARSAASLNHRHFLTVNGMTSYRRDEFPAQTRELPGAPGEIELPNLPPSELPTQTQMGWIVFSDDQATACFFVEAMDDAWAQLATDAAQIFYVMEQSVDEGASLDTGSGMNDHSARFIYHQDMFILEQDLQRNLFGPDVDRFRFGFDDRDAVTRTNRLPCAAGFSVDQDVAALNQTLNS